MAHEITSTDGAIMTTSSWHGLEIVEAMPDAETMIRRAEEVRAWPTDVVLEAMRTTTGLDVPGAAVVATYHDGSRKAHTAVGTRYRVLDPKVWRDTVRAAVAAGAKPAGAFSLRGGGRVLATFEIDDAADVGIKRHLNLVDALDGSLSFIAGGSSFRVVCANTLAAAMGGRRSSDAARNGWAVIRHTASINDRAAELQEAIASHVAEGGKVADLYRHARETALSREDAKQLFDVLFPAPTKEEREEQPRRAARLENARKDATRAMKRPENYEGATLATLWNGATWAVDRKADGRARKVGGAGDALDSMLLGSRRDRVEEVRHLIEVVLRDGTTRAVEASEASAMGVDDAQIGRSLLADML